MDRTLVLVPLLCDVDYTVVFRKNDIQVFKGNRIIIEGSRDSEKKIWLMPLKNNNKKDKP